jgi:predicted nucleic acid-binding protein
VLSELGRRSPDPGVLAWFEGRRTPTLYLSVLTMGELRQSIDRLADDPRKHALLDWLQTDLPQFFAGRVLPIDARVADRWGQLAARAGRPLPAVDSLLAVTALTHGLTLVTRNLRDFQFPGLEVIDPWSTGAR